MSSSEKVTILIPVYNDWETLQLLLNQFTVEIHKEILDTFSFLIVNDGSDYLAIPQLITLNSFKILHLVHNVGHQKAIALGLSYLYDEGCNEKIVVMDSDGEDKPGDILNLIKTSYNLPDKIIFASRKKRYEGIYFQFLYKIYKIIFALLTGKTIDFGNFCIIPPQLLKKIVFVSEIWNHFSGGVIHSKLPYSAIPLEKGKRLSGKSTMNFNGLIMHGLSSVAVHINIVAVRLLLFSLVLVFLTVIGILVVSYIRLFTGMAIPGWASFVVLGLFIIFMQACFISLFLVFMVLAYRTQRHFIPALHYKDYVESVEIIEC